MIYADHAATTPLRPEARAAMEPHLGEVFGNPSGLHEPSRRAKQALEDLRHGVDGFPVIDIRRIKLLGIRPAGKNKRRRLIR